MSGLYHAQLGVDRESQLRVRVTQRSRAQTADRSRGDFEYVDPAIIEAAFSMDRTVREPDRRRRAHDGLLDPRLRLRVERRRRDVDRFLEERTVERIRLVEQREDR